MEEEVEKGGLLPVERRQERRGRSPERRDQGLWRKRQKGGLLPVERRQVLLSGEVQV